MKLLRICVVFAVVCIAISLAGNVVAPNQAEPVDLDGAGSSVADVEKKTEKRGIYGFGYGHGGGFGGYGGYGGYGGHGHYGGHGFYGGPYYGGYAVHHAPYYGHHGFYPYHGDGYFH